MSVPPSLPPVSTREPAPNAVGTPVRRGPPAGVDGAARPRDAARVPRPAPSPGIDAFLAWAALAGSAPALVVLAGIPAPGSPGGTTARGIVLVAFWLLAPGGAVAPHLRLPGLAKAAVTPLIGLTVLIASALVGAWTGAWAPRESAAAVAALALGAALIGLSRHDVRMQPGSWPWPRRGGVVLLLGLLAGLGLWVAALPAIREGTPSVLGLLVSGPWEFPAALLVVVLVLVLALLGRHTVTAGAAVLGLIVVLRSTASVVSTVPAYAWTYKHLGVVEALQQHHHVVAGSDIYMNWPGMFAAGAYLSDASGMPVIDLARWITPLVHVILALETAALARALGARAPGCTAAAALVVALNWVGQDYFSPQAVAMCLAGGVVTLLVLSRTSRTAGVLTLVLFAAIVPTHQLTPFWLLAVAVLLVLLRRAPWWVGGVMLLLLGAYLLSRLQVAEAYGLFSGFDPVANAAGNVPLGPAVGRQIGGLFAKTTSLLVWGSTLAVLAGRMLRLGWRRGWRSPQVLVPAVLCFSPFLLLAGQNYGGEASLRVTLYSTLGCAAVLGPAVVKGLRRSTLYALFVTAWTLLVVGSAAESAYNLWSVDRMRPEDVAAARWLVEQHPNADVVPVVANWPGRTSVDYLRYVGAFSTLEPGLDDLVRQDLPAFVPPGSPYIPLSADLVARVAQLNPGKQTYVVFTEAMQAYDAYYGTYTPGSYEATLRSMLAGPQWQLVRHQNHLWVFLYRPPATPTG